MVTLSHGRSSDTTVRASIWRTYCPPPIGCIPEAFTQRKQIEKGRSHTCLPFAHCLHTMKEWAIKKWPDSSEFVYSCRRCDQRGLGGCIALREAFTDCRVESPGRCWRTIAGDFDPIQSIIRTCFRNVIDHIPLRLDSRPGNHLGLRQAGRKQKARLLRYQGKRREKSRE